MFTIAIKEKRGRNLDISAVYWQWKSPGENSGESYFEFLEEYYKMENTSVADKIKIVGSGSDHAGFAFYAGVPATFHIAV